MVMQVAMVAALYAFNYGGKPAEGLDGARVVRTLRDDADARQVVREWTSPDGRLVLRSTETEYRKFPVTEYVPELVAVGSEPTEIVEDFRTLDFRCASGRTTLRALRGTVCNEHDFAPVTPILGTGKGETNGFAMVATEGRSSAQWMPWWGVDFAAGDGLEIGLGWTGAWRADFSADGKGFAMSAGMVRTRFRLFAGETLRQPSLLVFRRGQGTTPRQMQTLIHRFMVDVKSPRDRKGELIHGISAITAGGGNKTPAMMKKIIDWKVANRMPFDCFWVDAGWNGPAHMPDLISNCGNMWYNFTGDWRFNPTVHPDGDLGKVADAAHAAGMRMLLWMEPERCVSDPPPPVFKEHRDWLLPRADKDIANKRQLSVNFGDPAALDWVIETVSEHVRRCKLDVFRQDFNMNTLPLWQANDAPDRQGVTEAKHIMGLWKFWDTLRERFPHLVVENCASGGRRLDFEAVSRGHSYCRTDYAIFHRDPSQITDVQNVTLNTLAYLPFQGSESTPAVFFDDYGILSSFASGNVFTPSDWNAGIVKNDFTAEQVEWLREAFTVGRRMMPFYEGDFYPLTDSRDAVALDGAWRSGNPDEHRWCAWQLHRADQDAGFAIFFRRLNTPNHVFTATLGGIDENAEYTVETWRGKTERMRGRDLRALTVELRQPRSFRLVFYRKAKPAQVYEQPGWCVWCPSPVRLPDGRYALVHSRWPEKDGFEAWCAKSEVALAVSQSGPLGPYTFAKTILGGSGREGDFDRDVTHNPQVLVDGGKYYLYYMGTRGDAGEAKPGASSSGVKRGSYRMNQRIGVAVADAIEGPYRRTGKSLFPEAPERLMTSNPSVVKMPNGKYLMVFKWGWPPALPWPRCYTTCAAAVADHPLGPWRIVSKDVFPVTCANFPGEDPCLWLEGDVICCSIHDMGRFYSQEDRALIRFESRDGVHWTNRGVLFPRGAASRLERPFVLSDADGSRILFAASKPSAASSKSVIVAYPGVVR